MQTQASSSALLKHMRAGRDDLVERQRVVASLEVQLTFVYDNWQEAQRLTYMRNGEPTSFKHGTVRAIIRHRQPPFPTGTQFRRKDGRVVTSIAAPAKVRDEGSGLEDSFQLSYPLGGACGSLVWPRCGWEVLHVPGLVQAVAVTYLDQDVPAPPGLPSASAYLDALRTANIQVMMLRNGASVSRAGPRPQHGADKAAKRAPSPASQHLVSFKDDFKRAAGLQQRSVLQWNHDVMLPTDIMYLEMVPHDETSNVGAALVMDGVLRAAGFLTPDNQLAPNCMDRVMFLYGDRLSVKRVEDLTPTFVARQAGSGEHQAERATVYLRAMSRVKQFPGDLHVLMHSLDLVFRVYYGGFLQARASRRPCHGPLTRTPPFPAYVAFRVCNDIAR